MHWDLLLGVSVYEQRAKLLFELGRAQARAATQSSSAAQVGMCGTCSVVIGGSLMSKRLQVALRFR